MPDLDPRSHDFVMQALTKNACPLDIDRVHCQYRLLLLIREFDDRFGWAKWSFRNGADWLVWRSGVTLSAAREKVRTAQALRGPPQISKAFAAGQLSYSKVRALTRAAQGHNEDLLLAYALTATATQVEERCRQMRNVQPSFTAQGRRSWGRRTLSAWRNAERGTMTISLEAPLEAGALVTEAIDRAIEAGEAASGPEFEEVSWQTQQADALVAVARAYLDGSTIHGAGVVERRPLSGGDAPRRAGTAWRGRARRSARRDGEASRLRRQPGDTPGI